MIILIKTHPPFFYFLSFLLCLKHFCFQKIHVLWYMHSHIILQKEFDYQNQYASVDTVEYTIPYLVFESPVFKIKYENNYYSFKKACCCNSD